MATRTATILDLPSGVLASAHDIGNSVNGTYADGALVSVDKDLSPAGLDETQNNSGQQPSYSATGLGGKPALSFNGGKYFNSNLSASAAIRTFVVVLSVTTGSNRTIYGSSAVGGLQFRVESDGQLGFNKENQVVLGRSGTTLASNTGALVAGSYNQNTGAWSLRINGTTAASGTNKQTLVSTLAQLGINGGGQNEQFVGLIGKRAALNDDTLSNIQFAEGVYAWEMGGAYPGLLPANHPYKAAAPTVDTGGGTVILRRRPLLLLAS